MAGNQGRRNLKEPVASQPQTRSETGEHMHAHRSAPMFHSYAIQGTAQGGGDTHTRFVLPTSINQLRKIPHRLAPRANLIQQFPIKSFLW